MSRTLAVLAFALSPVAPAAEPVGSIDMEQYEGLWYEIGSTPAPFEQNCEGGATAHYSLRDDGSVAVLNRCDLPADETSRIEGVARPENDAGSALTVTFRGQPSREETNYIIHATGPVEDGRYRWAVVSGSGGKPAWILARDPALSGDAMVEARAAFEAAGLDYALFETTPQPPRTYEP
ncbi:lipocalin family protein [Rhodosalinus sp.]|uniref:lipocalin family protein n=1 Tax=Rhodosalinus sp. TaxID=2047741 RepID=UPI003979E257